MTSCNITESFKKNIITLSFVLCVSLIRVDYIINQIYFNLKRIRVKLPFLLFCYFCATEAINETTETEIQNKGSPWKAGN